MYEVASYISFSISRCCILGEFFRLPTISDYWKRKFFYTISLENNLEIYSQLNIFVPYDPNNSILGVCSRSNTNVLQRVMAKNVGCSIVCKDGKDRNDLNVHVQKKRT